ALPFQVDQHRGVHLVPIPGIIWLVLEVRFDLARVGIKREHGAGVEIVAGVNVAWPRCGVANAPIDGLGVRVVIAGHPGRSAAGFPVVAAPGVVAGLTLAVYGEVPPQLLAVIGIKRNDIAADAEFAARTADDN